MTDKELIKLCKKNKRTAQNLLFERFEGYLMGICKRYAANQEEAKDIFQEAFIKIFKGIKKTKKIDSLPAWLSRVTVNTAINYYHKNFKHQNHYSYETQLDDFQQDDYIQIIEKMDVEYLTRLINQLPEGYRIVFNMYMIDG